KVKPPRSCAWPPKMPVNMTCLYKSVGPLFSREEIEFKPGDEVVLEVVKPADIRVTVSSSYRTHSAGISPEDTVEDDVYASREGSTGFISGKKKESKFSDAESSESSRSTQGGHYDKQMADILDE